MQLDMVMIAAGLVYAAAAATPGCINSQCASDHMGKNGGSLLQAKYERRQRDTLLEVASRGTMSEHCEPFPGKRVVLVTVNMEYLDMFTNWLGFAMPFLQVTEHLHVMAEDADVTERLEKLRKDHQLEFTVASQSDSSELSLIGDPFGSKPYGNLVWKRPWHILDLLQKNCTVLYTDIDTVWKKDPFHDIDVAGSGELFLTDDSNVTGWNYCTCFMYMQPTAATRSLMRDWGSHASTNMNQQVFNQRLQRVLGTSTLPRESLQILPFANFPPGEWVDDHPNPSVYHANWISGIKTKVEFFQNRSLWKPASFAQHSG